MFEEQTFLGILCDYQQKTGIYIYIYIYTLHGNKVLTHLSIMSQKKSKKNFILKKHNNNANHNDDKNDKTDAVISFK